jgi:glutathione peroxidase
MSPPRYIRALAVAALLAIAPAWAQGPNPPKPPTPPAPPTVAASAYDFRFSALTGGEIDLKAYRGKAILVVNTASKCGFTPQLKGLQALSEARTKDGLVVIGVPSDDFNQELSTAKEIKDFCELNYGVRFPMAAKTVVSGRAAHPFYRFASARLGATAEPRWNFHKILIDRRGRPVAAFPSKVGPDSAELRTAIDRALR